MNLQLNFSEKNVGKKTDVLMLKQIIIKFYTVLQSKAFNKTKLSRFKRTGWPSHREDTAGTDVGQVYLSFIK